MVQLVYMYYVYVIQNDLGKIYIGYTADLIKRIKRHNHQLPNKSSSFTSKNRGPWLLVYSEILNDRATAMRREKELKSFRGREYIKQKLVNEL